VHGQDNLAMLWVKAPRASVNLTLSPDLAARVWCSTLPEVALPAAVAKTERGEGLARKAAFEEAVDCSGKFGEGSCEVDLPSARFEMSHRLPGVLIETRGMISVHVESWIQSLTRRKSLQT